MKMFSLSSENETVTRSVLSPWVTLVTKSYSSAQGPVVYHSLEQSDYIAIFALRDDGKIPVVRQYRPAVGMKTLELPAGLLEKGESPEVCAERELFEETGLKLTSPLKLLGEYFADTGRLNNKVWLYFAGACRADSSWKPEVGLELLWCTKAELQQHVENGNFQHSMHVAAITLSVVKNEFHF